MALVNSKSLLQRNIEYLQSYGITDLVINIHHFGEQIVDFLAKNDNFGSTIEISDEHEALLETGGGLLFAKRFLEKESSFLIMNVDILTDLDLSTFIAAHKRDEHFVTLAVSNRESSRKLLFDDNLVLKGWLNKNTGEQRLAEYNNGFKELAFSGIHCVNSSIFAKMSRTGKFSIMTEYLDLMNTEKIVGFEHHSFLVDVGKPESIAIAEGYFA